MERRVRLKVRLRLDFLGEFISRCRLVCGGGGGLYGDFFVEGLSC